MKRYEKRDILIQRLGGQCDNCGIMHDGSNGRIYDFHHIIQETKAFTLNVGNMNRRLTVLYAEADKCRLLCSNCHRLHHHNNEL